MSVDYVLVHSDNGPADTQVDLLRMDDIARCTGLHPDMIRRLYRIGLFDAERVEDDGPVFSTHALFRVRRTMRLRRDLGLSWLSLGLVEDLLERIEHLESHVRTLEAQLQLGDVVDQVVDGVVDDVG